MKIKKIIIGVVILTILIVSFAVYKSFLVNKYYYTEKIDIDKSIIFEKAININYKGTKDNTIKNEDIMFNNEFEGFIEKVESKLFVKYDENNKVKSGCLLTIKKQYANSLNYKSFSMYNDDPQIIDEDLKKYFEKKKIENDIDLINYLKNNYYLDNNIFTSKKQLKINCLLNNFFTKLVISKYGVTLISGDLNGYIVNQGENIKEIHLLNKDNQYIIMLQGDEITTDDFIIKLLESVKFI